MQRALIAGVDDRWTDVDYPPAMCRILVSSMGGAGEQIAILMGLFNRLKLAALRKAHCALVIAICALQLAARQPSSHNVRVTLDQLRTFLQIVECSSVRRAAQKMHVTQPALSARLAALEESLGTGLFERQSQGLLLTKAGADLVPLAQQMIELSDRIRSAVTPEDRVSGLVRIGCAETIVQAWLPNLVSAIQSRYSSLSVEVSVDVSVNLRDQLVGRSIDLAILMGPVSEYSIENLDLPTFALGWFMAGSQPRSKAPDLTKVPIVTYARNTRPFRELRSALHDRYGPNVRLFPSSSLSACFKMVAAGLGVGVLPVKLAESQVQEGALAPFDPGWSANPLRFTASYVAEPENVLIREIAHLAHKTASAHA